MCHCVCSKHVLSAEPVAWQLRHNHAMALKGFIAGSSNANIAPLLEHITAAIASHIADDKVCVCAQSCVCLMCESVFVWCMRVYSCVCVCVHKHV